MRRISPSVNRGLALLALPLFLAGCSDKSVTYYEVPRENQSAGPAGISSMLSANAGGTTTPAGSRATRAQLDWTKPDAWNSKPPSQMRLGSYSFTAADGTVADISVFSFPDAAGGLLANINRWRGQINLPPLTEDALDANTKRMTVAEFPAWLVDFSGTASGATGPMGNAPAPAGPTRLLGAIVPVEGNSWFFKMIGPGPVVSSQRDNFDAWIASIKRSMPSMPAETGGAPGAAPSDPHAGIPGAPPLASSGSTMMDPNAIPTPPKPTGVDFTAPQGWEKMPAGNMRVASFMIPGPGVPAAEVAVSNFPGTVGGDLANLNRWRGQLGLDPVDDAGLEKSVTKVTGPTGLEFLVFDLDSPAPGADGVRRRMIAAIMKQPDSTWFFKMNGESAHVGSQRDAFFEFLKSFRLQATP